MVQAQKCIYSKLVCYYFYFLHPFVIISFPSFILSSITFSPLPPNTLHQHVGQHVSACPNRFISSPPPNLICSKLPLPLPHTASFFSLLVVFVLPISSTVRRFVNPPWRR